MTRIPSYDDAVWPPLTRRRLLVRAAGAAAGVAVLAGCGASPSSGAATTTAASGASGATGATGSAGATASLVFDAAASTEETTTVATSAGERTVTYRLWSALPYVASPVDATYQSLNVKVPTAIDGEAVDASTAPILLVIGVGGYMSSSTSGGASGPLGGAPPAGAMAGAPPTGAMPAGGGPGGAGGGADRAGLALAAGHVVVEPGCRGRDLEASDGTWYGKAPAAIVDLKAAVRYLRANRGVLPGDVDRIVAAGTSAGGALAALLAASGGSDRYDAYLAELGAADADDVILAAGAWCPITDLDHADAAYEWTFGGVARDGVDAETSAALAALFPDYQASLGLTGTDGAALTADRLGAHAVAAYLAPSASAFLAALSDDDRAAYLADNAWITWSDGAASFAFADYVAHVGRAKGCPAFDTTDLSSAENSLFGDETTAARHFTDAGLRLAEGDPAAAIADGLREVVALMSPMGFLAAGGEGVARHWWIRHGSSDSDTSLPVIVNLAEAAAGAGAAVDLRLYWDAGHGADEDPEDFVAWVGGLTA